MSDGNEIARFDVEALANAQTLACDRYVALVWGLVDLLGVPELYGTAVGWDGGAVGNHTRLLFDDGISQLLLDPTIGLVGNDATFECLIGGVHQTDIASFYSRNDITTFNAAVINAAEHSSYKVWDAINFTPSLTEWQANYAAHLAVTIEHGNNSQPSPAPSAMTRLTQDPGTIGCSVERAATISMSARESIAPCFGETERTFDLIRRQLCRYRERC
ncbi:hypothetical protein ACVIHH_003671 [Bradyrhizobium sp. USDA 4518]